MSNIQRFIFAISILNCLLVSGCVDEASRADKLRYTIPEKWSLSEDTQKNPQHRKITLMTPSGDFAEMELLSGEHAFSIDSNEYMTRYIQSSLPTEELRENTEFEFGDVSRQGKHGYFMNVSAPGKTEVQFVLEFYQFATNDNNLFVVLTTDPGLKPEQQHEFDQFLGSISLGE